MNYEHYNPELKIVMDAIKEAREKSNYDEEKLKSSEFYQKLDQLFSKATIHDVSIWKYITIEENIITKYNIIETNLYCDYILINPNEPWKKVVKIMVNKYFGWNTVNEKNIYHYNY